MDTLNSFWQLPVMNTLVQDVKLQIAAAVFAAACKVVFGAGMQRLPHTRSFRIGWSVFMASVLVLVQPLIYRTPTQPLSIVLAALCVFDAFCMLTWGCIKPLTANPGPRDILRSSFDFMMDGVIKIHKRRQAVQAAAGTSVPASSDSNRTAAGSATSNKQQKRSEGQGAANPAALKASRGPGRPVIHVTAHVTLTSVSNAAANTKLSLINSKSSTDFTENSQQPVPTVSNSTTSIQNPYAALRTAILTHIRLCIIYDISFAALCCTTTFCNPAAQFTSTISRYLFSQAAGLLLPMQMSIGYAFARVCVLARGDWETGGALPEHAFNAPWLATSVSDLWSNRWHQFLRFYFQNLGYGFVNVTIRPLVHWLPLHIQKWVLSTASTLAVFAMSGLLHEYMIWAAFGVYSGKQMTFFMINALFVIAETNTARMFVKLRDQIPVWLKRVYAISVMILLAPLFTEPYRQHGYFQHCFHPFMWPVTATALRVLGLGTCV